MFDDEYDFLVVGSGAGALTGAIAAKTQGLSTLLVEKTDKIGGTSAVSGGGVWVPNNHVFNGVGEPDSRDRALRYMDASIGDETRSSSKQHRAAYVDSGPAMTTFLEQQGVRWRPQYPYPDYYSDLPGGSDTGRSLEPQGFDIRKLGAWEDKVRKDSSLPPLELYNSEANAFLVSTRTVKGFFTAAKVVGWRTVFNKLTGRRIVVCGRSLVAQLLKVALDRRVDIWLETPMRELIVEDGRVVGAVVERDGKTVRVRARKGVLLGSGGFSRNREIRERFQQVPVDIEWSLVPEGDDGDAYRVTSDLDAEMGNMGLAWWMPVFIDENGGTRFNIWERSLPFSIVVDSSGQRFVSESTGYLEFGNAMEERNKTVAAVPSWQILDSQHRKNYPFGTLPPGVTPAAAVRNGFLVRAESLRELASKIGIDPDALEGTVSRFNGFARTGVDEDFKRGHNVYERHYGDPRVKPNPNLGAIEKGPFYAVKLLLGDIGTKGGPLTDPEARVLRQDGEPIPGLYAVGNAVASTMDNAYPGAGATIGPSMIFAYRAALEAARAEIPAN